METYIFCSNWKRICAMKHNLWSIIGKYQIIDLLFTSKFRIGIGTSLRVFFKACVRYFHQIFIFSPNDILQKLWKNAFYFIQNALFVLEIFKFFCFWPSLFFYLLAIALEDDWRQILKFMTSSVVWIRTLTHFVWYLEKEKRYEIETLSIDGVSDKEHFYRKVMQKMYSKS